MAKEQYITSSLYTFADMREYNYLYVDKTEFLWKLVSHPKSMFFFSRPRRFGKSLTLSTLKAIFQGKKELFKDLYIENQPYDWKPYPVIHIDMGSNASSTPEELKEELISIIKNIAIELDVEITETLYNKKFEELIKKLYKRDGKVVILIDEYDKPILNNIEKENIADFQAIMKGFYSVLKTCEPYERFVFITGVGKFLKVSIFSDLNNLSDISMNDDFAEMCGYTEKELEENFKTQLIETHKNSDYTFDFDTFLKEIKKWYDGYKFSKRGKNVYNPVSLAKFLENHGDFSNYWFETGTPSILVKLFKSQTFDLSEALKEKYQKEIFTAFEPSRVSIIALMYQTGYLTIKNVKTVRNINRFELGFPNFEVEDSFYRYLLTNINNKINAADYVYLKICDAVEENDVDKMLSTLNSFLADIPYSIQIKNEKYYQSIFFSIFKLVGTSIKTEVETSDGRIDATIESNTNIFIFEFKLDKSAEIALDQIVNKEYYKPYLNSGKKITLIGANFNSETRKMSDWVKKEIR